MEPPCPQRAGQGIAMKPVLNAQENRTPLTCFGPLRHAACPQKRLGLSWKSPV